MLKFGAAAAAMAAVPRGRATEAPAVPGVSFASVKESLRFTMPSLGGKCRFMVVGDSHLTIDDERGEPFKQYSDRMSKPYRSALHFRTRRLIASPEGFEYALAEAKKMKVDFLALVGDIVSFPSEAGVEYVKRRLDESGLNWMYISGNHDWHYEGLPGTEMALRAEWTKKRLTPLYQGADPMMASRVVNGIRFVFIDNSLYEILPEQLAFWKQEAAKGEPVALMMHIPLYMPGYGPREAGCAHPEWGAKVVPTGRSSAVRNGQRPGIRPRRSRSARPCFPRRTCWAYSSGTCTGTSSRLTGGMCSAPLPPTSTGRFSTCVSTADGCVHAKERQMTVCRMSRY